MKAAIVLFFALLDEKQRRKLIDPEKNTPYVGPGDPYPFQGEENPYKDLIEKLNEVLKEEELNQKNKE
mgnify:CR=1 FL=1